MEAIQNISGTEFKYKIIKELGLIKGKKIYMVKNIETGFTTTLT